MNKRRKYDLIPMCLAGVILSIIAIMVNDIPIALFWILIWFLLRDYLEERDRLKRRTK